MDAAAKVRTLVESDCGDLDEESWDWLLGIYFAREEPDWGVATPEAIAGELLGELRTAAAVMRHVGKAPRSVELVAARSAATSAGDGLTVGPRADYPHSPSWWNERSRKVTADSRGMQKLVWSLLERDEPLALSDVEAFLLGARKLEREVGVRQTLVYPNAASIPGLIVRSEMQVHSGWTGSELKAAGRGGAWFSQRTQPLTRISRCITSLAARTGCSEEDISAFLLCDVALRLPWVSFDYAWPGPPATINQAIVLTIATPDVPADDVRRAYVYARDALRSIQATPEGPARRRSRNTTWELVAFVEERRPEIKWDDIHGQWLDAHPRNSKGYHSTMKSMRAAYYRAPMRRKAVAT